MVTCQKISGELRTILSPGRMVIKSGIFTSSCGVVEVWISSFLFFCGAQALIRARMRKKKIDFFILNLLLIIVSQAEGKCNF